MSRLICSTVYMCKKLTTLHKNNIVPVCMFWLLTYMCTYDPVTGTYNRTYLYCMLSRSLYIHSSKLTSINTINFLTFILNSDLYLVFRPLSCIQSESIPFFEGLNAITVSHFSLQSKLLLLIAQ